MGFGTSIWVIALVLHGLSTQFFMNGQLLHNPIIHIFSPSYVKRNCVVKIEALYIQKKNQGIKNWKYILWFSNSIMHTISSRHNLISLSVDEWKEREKRSEEKFE